MAYYHAFLHERYPRIGEWHKELENEAIRTKHIVLPTGREYAFPGTRRMKWGGVMNATKIKNYPVQGYATGDIVPLANILVWRLMRQAAVESLMINTVHDSLVADVYPGEERVMAELFREGMLGVVPELKARYGIELTVPLDIELKIGSNWLDTTELKLEAVN